MPKSYVRLGEGWLERHPGWEMRLWTDYELRNRDLFEGAERYVPAPNVWQFRSDVMRLEVLYDHGGVYIDCDFECLRPIDPLLADVSCFVAWEVEGVWANNAIMGATARHPWIGELIERLPERAEAMRGAKPNRMSGPRFVTDHLDPGVRVFPEALFYPYSFAELDRAGERFPGAYAVHHWGNRRRMKAKPL